MCDRKIRHAGNVCGSQQTLYFLSLIFCLKVRATKKIGQKIVLATIDACQEALPANFPVVPKITPLIFLSHIFLSNRICPDGEIQRKTDSRLGSSVLSEGCVTRSIHSYNKGKTNIVSKVAVINPPMHKEKIIMTTNAILFICTGIYR